jgi:hypothetical protein
MFDATERLEKALSSQASHLSFDGMPRRTIVCCTSQSPWGVLQAFRPAMAPVKLPLLAAEVIQNS